LNKLGSILNHSSIASHGVLILSFLTNQDFSLNKAEKSLEVIELYDENPSCFKLNPIHKKLGLNIGKVSAILATIG
jgi:hypothetical protein